MKIIKYSIGIIVSAVALFSQSQAIDLPLGLKFGMSREQVTITLGVDSVAQSPMRRGQLQEFHQLKLYKVGVRIMPTWITAMSPGEMSAPENTPAKDTVSKTGDINRNYKGLNASEIRLDICDKWGLVEVSFEIDSEDSVGRLDNVIDELIDEVGQPKIYNGCEYVWRYGDIGIIFDNCVFPILEYFHKNRINAAHDDELYFARNSPDAYEGSLFLTDFYGRPSKEIYVKVFFWESGDREEGTFLKYQRVTEIYLKLINTSRDDYANLIAYAPMIEFKAQYPGYEHPLAFCLPQELKRKKLANNDDGIVAPGDTAETLFHFTDEKGRRHFVPDDVHPLEKNYSINKIIKGEARLVIQLDGMLFSFDNIRKCDK